MYSQESNDLDLGNISGNTQVIAQYYNEDTLINAALPDHIMGLNSFTNINYSRGKFNAGIRYETYLNPLEGYPSGFSGTGIGYRYANWNLLIALCYIHMVLPTHLLYGAANARLE